ncbi:hypothetical protein CkaCkLH20_12980 [Colletotrichum karsti]|uniref:Uncharacterized protein n=1 Tax=Colletotrichum karsti TaxID=1095194 RepID=A0A9P6HTT3_9PEZI|nr:uncharacterized protein CkaCkLH20_12980 [Colletotrichum karsti]KAF9869587.1 hypothetical protein CkaCkLH20_12980 [Colletotrichum karsti]
MAPSSTTVVISGVRHLDSSEKAMADDLLRALRHHNCPKPYDARLFPEENTCELILQKMSKAAYENIPISDTQRWSFWAMVFANGWDTASPNPRPASLGARTLAEAAYFVGKIIRDAPSIDIDDMAMKEHFIGDQDQPIAGTFEGSDEYIIPKGQKVTKKDDDKAGTTDNDDETDTEATDTVPDHRRAGQPSAIKPFLDWPDDGVWYFWVDREGGHLEPADVALVRDMDLEDVKDKVREHYDKNEIRRVGDWNRDMVIWMVRERLISAAKSKSAGKKFNVKVHARKENLDDLQQIRTCLAEVEDESRPALNVRLSAYNVKHGLPSLPTMPSCA